MRLRRRVVQDKVKKFIIIPCILSIVGHSLFFGILKSEIKHELPRRNSQLYFISGEQFDYIASVPKKIGDILLYPLPKSFSSKNAVWGDKLAIVKDIDIAKIDIETKEDMEFISDSKGYNFQEIQIPLDYLEEKRRDFLPIFSNIFSTGLLSEGEQRDSEYTINLDNNIKMSYFVRGPALNRSLALDNIPHIEFNADKNDVRVKLRFWISSDGRVNQVVVEESSSFPLIDSEIINLVKTWHFSPMYDPAAPKYEWGVAHIRLQR